MNTASRYVVAFKGDEVLVIPIETFSYGPEESEEQQAAKITAKLTAKGYECKTGYPCAAASLLD